ncbi:THAP domain containing 12a isoform X1 [Hippocampus comes]|uniref:THAP domain containing 12a n=1 Tax=Hippocampus comes TaxID=109280 RepID=A0A3Q3DYP6_HIPCM|nr:PREDICTED: 52 kDa repressor of the inhibitor of the protein kinase-like isoform X1 [Hippocampus comes]
MQNQCAAPNCTSLKSDLYSLFRFPLDAERCKMWVEKCQREDLVDKSPEHLFRYYRLCAKHFETSDDSSEPVTVIKDDAIPTIFDDPNKLQNAQVKRSKEMDEDTKTRGRKKIKSSQAEVDKEEPKTTPEEDTYKNYLRSLFEALVLLGEQNIPVTSSNTTEQDSVGLNNFEALLEYRMSCGDEGMKKYDANREGSSSLQLKQLIEVCEKCIRSKVMEDVKENGFFSLITDDLVKISDEWYLPVFLRYVDDSNYQRERFVGFLSFDGDADVLAEKLLSEMINEWGLNMEKCRGQAHSCSGTHFAKIKAFAAKVTEKYPLAMLTVRPTQALNITLANGMALSGVQLVMCTLKKIESFFNQSPLLRLELEHAISVIYPDKEEKVKELKETCCTGWTRRHDAFEVTLDLLEALLLCVDSVHDNEDLRWSDQITYNALEISKALADFEFIMALVVLKNTMILLRAFGKNIEGEATDVYFAAGSVKAVLHSLKEVSDNIDVYHEFWTEEAVNLSATMEIPVELPRSLLRKHPSELGSLQPENYYKEHLSLPVVNHTLKEVTELFSDDHLKALRCLSLVPFVVELNKAGQPEEENMLVFKNDIPNPGSLTAELHCWWVKWNKKGKGEVLLSSLQETLQQADVKFFPNMLAVLRLLGVLPTLALDISCDVAYKRFKMYMQNTPDAAKSKSLALLNINNDVGYDLDSMVEVYMKTYPGGDDAL